MSANLIIPHLESRIKIWFELVGQALLLYKQRLHLKFPRNVIDLRPRESRALERHRAQLIKIYKEN